MSWNLETVVKFMKSDRGAITVISETHPSGWDFGSEVAPATRLVIPPQNAHDFVIGYRKQLTSGRGLLNAVDEFNVNNKLQCGGQTRTSITMEAIIPSCDPGYY